MYAEDKRFLPDDTPPTLPAIDALWASYPADMGDETYWGPRPRLRCAERLVPPGEALRCLMKARPGPSNSAPRAAPIAHAPITHAPIAHPRT